MRNIGILIVAGLVACGGAETRPDPRPEAILPVVLMKADPPPNCVERGSLMEAIWWGDVEGARRNLRKKAAAMGANYVRLELPSSGTAYWCPPQPAPPDAPAPYSATEQLRPLPPPVSPNAIALMKADPPPSCVERGTVMEAIWFGDVEGARNKLRQKAAAMGANYVRLELPSSGTAYYCPLAR
jgi:hypothetical protein